MEDERLLGNLIAEKKVCIDQIMFTQIHVSTYQYVGLGKPLNVQNAVKERRGPLAFESVAQSHTSGLY